MPVANDVALSPEPLSSPVPLIQSPTTTTPRSAARFAAAIPAQPMFTGGTDGLGGAGDSPRISPALRPGIQLYSHGIEPGGFFEIQEGGTELVSDRREDLKPNQHKMNLRALYGNAKLCIRADRDFWYIAYQNIPENSEGFGLLVDDRQLLRMAEGECYKISRHQLVTLSSGEYVFELGFFSKRHREWIRDESERFQQSSRDSLTGLPNRMAWDIILRNFDQKRIPYTIVSFDVDGLKAANDHRAPPGFSGTAGHARGDRFISEICRMLKSRVRAEDVTLFRLHDGGDELYAVIKGKTADQCRSMVNRMMESVEGPGAEIVYEHRDTEGWLLWRQTICPTITAGIADSTMISGYSQVEKLADEQLMRAKGMGRRGGLWLQGAEIFVNMRLPIPQTYFAEDQSLIERVFSARDRLNVMMPLVLNQGEWEILQTVRKKLHDDALQLIRAAATTEAEKTVTSIEREQYEKRFSLSFMTITDDEVLRMSPGERVLLLELILKRVEFIYEAIFSRWDGKGVKEKIATYHAETKRLEAIVQMLVNSDRVLSIRDLLSDIHLHARDA